MERFVGTLIVCGLCSKTRESDDICRWWVGVDRECNDLYLCRECQSVAHYCDICQSIHGEGEIGLVCSYALCPCCEELFRAHPAYIGLCPQCVTGGCRTSEPWRIWKRLPRRSCA